MRNIYDSYFVAKIYPGLTSPVIVHECDNEADAEDLADTLARTQHYKYTVLKSQFIYDDKPDPAITP